MATIFWCDVDKIILANDIEVLADHLIKRKKKIKKKN